MVLKLRAVGLSSDSFRGLSLMGAVKQFIELKIQSKIGVNATVIIGLIVALLAAVVTFVFALVILFIWIAGRYSPVPQRRLQI